MPWPSILLMLTCLDPQQPNGGSDAFAGTVVFSRSQIVAARTWELTGDGGVKAVRPSGETVVVPAKDVLLLETGTAELRGQRPHVLLRNGELISATPLAGGKGRRWSFTSPLLGSFELEESLIATWQALDRPSSDGQGQAAPAAPAKDRLVPPSVLLRNGDVVTAGVDQVGSGQVTVSTEFGQTQIPLETVSAIVLAADPTASDGRTANQLMVALADGQRLYCEAIGEADGRLVLTRGAGQCRVERQAVMRIVWPAATLTYLSENPSKGEGLSYFGRPAPPRKDRNALGGPLRIGDRWFDRGLGMRPRSQAVYQLNASWMYLAGYAGLDPWLGRRGNCQIAVNVDGKEVVRQPLRGGQRAYRLLTPVAGAKEIGLKADFGPDGDLGDYVNWCDVMLIGTRGEAGKP